MTSANETKTTAVNIDMLGHWRGTGSRSFMVLASQDELKTWAATATNAQKRAALRMLNAGQIVFDR